MVIILTWVKIVWLWKLFLRMLREPQHDTPMLTTVELRQNEFYTESAVRLEWKSFSFLMKIKKQIQKRIKLSK